MPRQYRYQVTHSLADRKKESHSLRSHYPDYVPIVCEPAPDSGPLAGRRQILRELDCSKFLLPQRATMQQLIVLLRSRLLLPEDQGCSYRGERTADGKRFHEQGVFTFANGDTYVGSFNDGRMHGAGTLFFAPERGGGQYRGVWENGCSVSGAFVFGDGLVYGARAGCSPSPSSTPLPEPGPSPLAPAPFAPTPRGSSPSRQASSTETLPGARGQGWLYCREGDRRLWAEHLREVMPVLPSQTVLGGTRVPQATRWAAVPVVAPSVAIAAKIPAAFAQGQPRALGEIPREFWDDPEKRESVVRTTELPTPRFRGAQGDGGEETFGDGRPEMNLTQRIIKPVDPHVVRSMSLATTGVTTVPRPPSVREKGFVRNKISSDEAKPSPTELVTAVPLPTNGANLKMEEGQETGRISPKSRDGPCPPIFNSDATVVLEEGGAIENLLKIEKTQEVNATKEEQVDELPGEDVPRIVAAEQMQSSVYPTKEILAACVEPTLEVPSDANEEGDSASPKNVEQLENAADLPPQAEENLPLAATESDIVDTQSPEVDGSMMEKQDTLINEIRANIMEGRPARTPLPKENDEKEDSTL